MDLIDKYFELTGNRIDSQIMNYMGFDLEQKLAAELRLSSTLGVDGIDRIMKDTVKGIIKISSGGYDLKIKITNWDVDEPYGDTRRGDFEIDNVEVLIDPKSTVELMTNGYEYELGDLFNYSTFDDIDKINAEYDTEDDPITEDDIIEIQYEVHDVIKAWLYDNVYPLTGVEIDDIYSDTDTTIVERYDLNEQMKGFEVKPFALHADIFEKLWEGFEKGKLLRTYISLRAKIPNRQKYVDYFYEFILDNGEELKGEKD